MQGSRFSITRKEGSHNENMYVYYYWDDKKAIKFVTSKHGLNNITIIYELSFHHKAFPLKDQFILQGGAPVCNEFNTHKAFAR